MSENLREPIYPSLKGQFTPESKIYIFTAANGPNALWFTCFGSVSYLIFWKLIFEMLSKTTGKSLEQSASLALFSMVRQNHILNNNDTLSLLTFAMLVAR